MLICNETKQTEMKKLFYLIAGILLCSCGSTKVTVSKPAEGTSTTITVTTNNPITTNVDPTITTPNF